MIKFLMTGLPRSGTTVVSGALMTHPQILFYGELLNDMMSVRKGEAARMTLGAGWRIADAPQQPLRVCSEQDSGFDYLSGFYSINANAKAIGFKLLFDQALKGQNAQAWRYLADNPDIHIVSTKRGNLLEVVCSYSKAVATNQWHSTQEIDTSRQLMLPIETCEKLFKRFTKTPEALSQMKNTHKVLEVDYQCVCNDFTGTMNQIFNFLELDAKVESKPLLKKIALNTPRDELVNYDELKSHFEKTVYEKYFCY
jgi:hypothetical protein